MAYLLRLENVVAGYGNTTVLHGVDLEIPPKGRILLIGPNGAGKSTVFKVISGLIRPKKGKVIFNGYNITDWSIKKRVESGLGYLLQTNNIIPNLTGEENLELSGAFLPKKEFKKRLSEITEVIPILKPLLKKRAGLLSGGERQLLAISMILIRHPKLLLLDEPTAGLSPKAASEIIKYLQKLQDALGIDAICMVEHNLKECLPWANEGFIIVNGKVVHNFKDTKETLKNPKEIEKFFFENA